MTKLKNISMMMTLVALMAFMAHIVVPHHHHKGGICIDMANVEVVEMECDLSGECFDCSHKGDCSHNDESQDERCKAYDPFLSRITGGDDDVNKFVADIQLYLPIIAVSVLYGEAILPDPIAFKPPVSEVYLDFIVKSAGLRAPPKAA